MRRSERRSSGSPKSAFAAPTPPTIAAALDPRPRAIGIADRIRCGLDLGDRAGERARAFRVLEAVTGEHADDSASLAQAADERELAKSGNGRGGRRLAEDPFTSRDECVRGEDLVVGDRID